MFWLGFAWSDHVTKLSESVSEVVVWGIVFNELNNPARERARKPQI